MDALVLPSGRSSNSGGVVDQGRFLGLQPGSYRSGSALFSAPLSPLAASGPGASPTCQSSIAAPWALTTKQPEQGWLGSSALSSTDPLHTYSMPNLVAFQNAAVVPDSVAGLRSNSFSNAAHPTTLGAGFGVNVPLQLPQPQQAGVLRDPAADSGLSPRFGESALVLPAASACNIGPTGCQEAQLLAQLAAGATSGNPSQLQALLTALGGPGATYSKLQLLEQLQAVIAQQQQQLQLQLCSQHGIPPTASTSHAATAPGRTGGSIEGSRLRFSSCDGSAQGRCSHAGAAGYDDTLHSRDQAEAAVFGALAGSSTKGGMLSLEAVAAGTCASSLQQQQLLLQETLFAGSTLADTPTALAALPPGLLDDVVGGIDTSAGGVVSQHWGASKLSNSSTCSLSRLARASGSAVSTSGGLPMRPGDAATAGSGYNDASVAALHQQLQQAIQQLENLHISGTAGAAEHPTGSKAWDWALAASLLRTDSNMSRSSINRTSSGVTASDSSASSMPWLDVAGSTAGSGVPAAAMLGLQGVVGGPAGALLPPAQCVTLGPAALQRTLSNVSCSSAVSGSGTPRTGQHSTLRQSGCGSRLGSRSSSCCGGHSTAFNDAVAQGECGAPGAGRPGVGGSRSCRPQNASVDSLLQQCAPRWAKAGGWDPRSTVATAPAVGKGTGAFMRLPANSDNGAGAKGVVAGDKASGRASSSKGTGAFIPPSVRAAVAAAASLT